jgi:hypothetical protein
LGYLFHHVSSASTSPQIVTVDTEYIRVVLTTITSFKDFSEQEWQRPRKHIARIFSRAARTPVAQELAQ